MDIIIAFIVLLAITVVLGSLIRTLWDMQDLRDEMAALRADNTGLFMVLKHHIEGLPIDFKLLTRDGTPIRDTPEEK